MKITKETCTALRDELAQVLPDIQKKLGILIRVGPMRYNEDSISFTCKCSAAEEGVDTSDEEAVAEMEFKRHAARFKGDPDRYHRKIMLRKVVYTITGIDPNARTDAFLITRDSDGKLYRANHDTISLGLQDYICHTSASKELK